MYQGIATKCLTGEVRLSYVFVNKPSETTGKYSVALLIPKSDLSTKADLDSAFEAAAQKGIKEKWGGVRPRFDYIIHDGDGNKDDGTPYPDECKGCWVLNAKASADRKPQVVGIDNINVELAPQDIYSGMYGRVTVNFYPYVNPQGGKGVACGLGNILKTRDGESLSGGASAASDFAGIGQAIAATAPAAMPTQAAAPAVMPNPAAYQPPVPAYPGQMAGAYPVNPAAPNAPVATAPMVGVQINPVTGQPM